MNNFSDLTRRLLNLKFSSESESDNVRLYIQGDLHGSNYWKKLYSEYKKDPIENKYFIFLGDAVDPEPKDMRSRAKEGNPYTPEEDDSYRLQDWVYKNLDDIKKTLKEKNTYFILGNHECIRLMPYYKDLPERVFTRMREKYFNHFKEEDNSLYYKWLDIAEQLKNFIDNNNQKIRIAMQFGNILVSHVGVEHNFIDDYPIDENVTVSKIVNDPYYYLRSFQKEKTSHHGVYVRSEELAKFSKFNDERFPIQIVGHYNGLEEDFPTIIDCGKETKVYMIDDSLRPNGKIRSIIVDTNGKDKFKYKVFD